MKTQCDTEMAHLLSRRTSVNPKAPGEEGLRVSQLNKTPSPSPNEDQEAGSTPREESEPRSRQQRRFAQSKDESVRDMLHHPKFRGRATKIALQLAVSIVIVQELELTDRGLLFSNHRQMMKANLRCHLRVLPKKPTPLPRYFKRSSME